jgi:succinate-semialdehyde dehydrogenase/glutarate-semialdehyde dehydrogenase
MSASSPATSGNGDSRLIASHNPATGELLGSVEACTPDQVRAVVVKARRAQATWRRLDPKERGKRLMRVRGGLVERAEEIASRITAESGKTRVESLSMEITGLADLVTYFSKRAHKILAPERIPLHLMKHRRSYLHYQPRGVVGIISPWNFPFLIPMGEAYMALLAGNAVVLKPSEVTPLIADLGRELFVKAGIPADLFQVIHGKGEIGAALIESGVDMVCFTGSVATGRKVGAACGERLIPCVLELGGKAPAVVCEDADLERTAQALVWGAFANSGQICASVERVYAVESIHDELVAKVVENTNRLRHGDPDDIHTDVGAICFPRQLEVARELIDDAVAKGAVIQTGGEQVMDDTGMFFQPTVLTGVNQDMRCMRDESFSPLMPIMKVKSEEEAIELANDSNLGLLGYVFTRDRKKGRRLAEQIQSGTVMVNDVLVSYGLPETPWMGIKDSGLGRVHSAEGLRSLCQVRHVNHDFLFTPKREMWWFPYGQKAYKRALVTLRLLFGRNSKLGG